MRSQRTFIWMFSPIMSLKCDIQIYNSIKRRSIDDIRKWIELEFMLVANQFYFGKTPWITYSTMTGTTQETAKQSVLYWMINKLLIIWWMEKINHQFGHKQTNGNGHDFVSVKSIMQISNGGWWCLLKC